MTDISNNLVERDENGRLMPGSKLPNAGRPRGSRNKFGKAVLATYAQQVANGDFEQVLESLKSENPTAYAKLCNDAAMKQLDMENSGHGGLCEECGGEISGKTVLSINFVTPPESPSEAL